MEDIKVYFEKSKQVLSFVRKCDNIPEENNPFYNDTVERLLEEADLLPMLDELEAEYFEHIARIGQDNSHKYVVGLWENSSTAPSLEYLYVADNRLRAIGLIWAKMTHDIETFFARIGVPKINIYNEDVAIELLKKLSDLDTDSHEEVVPVQPPMESQPTFEPIDDIIIHQDAQRAKDIIKGVMKGTKNKTACIAIRALIMADIIKSEHTIARCKIFKIISEFLETDIGTDNSIGRHWDKSEGAAKDKCNQIKKSL
ncbi:MAG: hypothetical protein SNG79_03945 [Rikenellaceae bacterium]